MWSQVVRAIGDTGKITGDLSTEEHLLFKTALSLKYNIQYTDSSIKYVA